MVKKIRKTSAELPAGLLDSQLAQSVKESAQQIWLAGMGAFSKAQEGRAKVFEALIKEGASLQRKTQSAAEERIGEVTDRMSAMAGDVTAKAGQHWDKLESIFEQRTAKAMNKLGVPTAKDVDALIKRVDELAAAVARLSKGVPAKAAAAGAATRAAARRVAKPSAKTAAKKSAPRKPRG
jgi:poly(hydroxyalkanoate) granule-associated protein